MHSIELVRGVKFKGPIYRRLEFANIASPYRCYRCYRWMGHGYEGNGYGEPLDQTPRVQSNQIAQKGRGVL